MKKEQMTMMHFRIAKKQKRAFLAKAGKESTPSIVLRRFVDGYLDNQTK